MGLGLLETRTGMRCPTEGQGFVDVCPWEIRKPLCILRRTEGNDTTF